MEENAMHTVAVQYGRRPLWALHTGTSD